MSLLCLVLRKVSSAVDGRVHNTSIPYVVMISFGEPLYVVLFAGVGLSMKRPWSGMIVIHCCTP